MPEGMLAPGPVLDASRRDAAAAGELLSLSREAKREWFEIRVVAPAGDAGHGGPGHGAAGDAGARDAGAGEARYVSPDGMALVHDVFASTHPRFDPLVPGELVPPEELLVAQKLERFAREWRSVKSAEVAKERWGDRSELIAALADESQWLRAREAFGHTLDALGALLGHAGRAGANVSIGPSP
jgi:hypothetical protein